jgi:activator of HSP90 ATPase
MSKLIRQQVTIHASPHEVYEALMDSRKHAEFTGDEADISREVGGSFTAGSGYISGTNLELVPDGKIVQAWHASDWPEGHMSRVTFRMTAAQGGTRLDFTHSGVPVEHYDDIKQGWIDYYWIPLKAMFARR